MAQYEILNHGVCYPDTFQGCGTAFSVYDYATTGCGMNAKEAYEDAVESLYMIHDRTDVARLQLPTRPHGITKRDRVLVSDGEDAVYYVSIRYSL